MGGVDKGLFWHILTSVKRVGGSPGPAVGAGSGVAVGADFGQAGLAQAALDDLALAVDDHRERQAALVIAQLARQVGAFGLSLLVGVQNTFTPLIVPVM